MYLHTANRFTSLVLAHLFICPSANEMTMKGLDKMQCYTTMSTVKFLNISRTELGHKLVDHSNAAGASPVDGAQTTFSFSA